MPAGKLLPASEERHLLEIMPKKGHLGWPARLNIGHWRFVRLLEGGDAHLSGRTNANAGALSVLKFKVTIVLTLLVCAASLQAVGQDPTFRSESNVVLIPALVKNAAGGIAYGLTAKDFIVEDNGVVQGVRLDESVEGEPVSLVIAVQTGRRAPREFSRVAGLGAMLDPLLAQPSAKAALLEFDSEVHLTRNFTGSRDTIQQDLENLQGRDGGAVILDAVQSAVQLLNNTPVGHRRVLLLISETRDQGSKVAKLDDVVTAIGEANIAIYALTFSPSISQVLDTERGKNRDELGGGADLLAPIFMARQALRKNTPKAMAEMTGGEYELFTSRKSFENLMVAFTNHVHGRYELSFQPKDPAPGLHQIRVQLANPGNKTVLARNSYWARGASE